MDSNRASGSVSSSRVIKFKLDLKKNSPVVTTTSDCSDQSHLDAQHGDESRKSTVEVSTKGF